MTQILNALLGMKKAIDMHCMCMTYMA